MTYEIDEQVEVLYRGEWCTGHVVTWSDTHVWVDFCYVDWKCEEMGGTGKFEYEHVRKFDYEE